MLTAVYPSRYTVATMHFPQRVRLISFLQDHQNSISIAGAAVLLLAALMFLPGEERPSQQAPADRETHTLARASHVPYSFEGVLVPKEDTVLAAQVQGRLSDIATREGAQVHAGEVLAVVGQPVMVSQRKALVARIRLMEEQRDLVEAERGAGRALAVKAGESDRNVGAATIARTQAELDTAVSSLRATLAQQYLVGTEALDFLADTTALSSREVSELRVEATRVLAGSLRAGYLGQGVLTGGSARGFYDDLQAVGTDDHEALVSLAERLLTGLATLARAYESAERNAYERKSVLNEEELARYNEYRLAVRTAQATVETAQGAVRSALEAHNLSIVTTNGVGTVRSAELEKAEVVQAGEVRVTDATLASLYAELRSLDASLGEAVVRAPYTGRIVETYADAGAYVSPGTPLVRIQSASGFEVRTTIPERYVHRVKVGASATFRDGGTGVLDRIAPNVDELEGGALAFIVLNDTVESRTAGSRVRGEVELAIDEKEYAVFGIPHRYLSFDWSGPTVCTEAGTCVPVVVVRDTEEAVYVTGKDLADGLVLVP